MHWNGQWIWLPGEREQDYVYAHARREFAVEGPVGKAALSLTANNVYRLYLNGRFVGRGPDRSDPAYPYYDTYDVADLLRQGRNVLAVELYCITSKADRGRSWALYGGDPGLLLQLDWDEGGNPRQVATGADWRIAESPFRRKGAPRITRFVGFAEHYDAGAARSFGGWTGAGFDDSAWEAPALLGAPPGGPTGEPLPREQPFLVPVEHAPVSVGGFHRGDEPHQNLTTALGFSPDEPHTVFALPDSPTGVRFDFRRTLGGMPRVALADCCGGRMEIYCGENTREVLCDIVELPQDGELLYEPMDWRGAKHITLLFRDVPRPTVVRSVRFVEWQYPFEARGDFEADDPAFGRIWRACRETAHVGVKDHPQDCVHREQALWYGDLLVHARAAAACFGDMAPFEKACRQAARNVNQDGVLPVPGPCTQGYELGGESLGWSEQPLTVPLTVMRIYEHTGDPALARFCAPAVQRMMAHFARYEEGRGLLDTDKPGMQKLVVFTGWGSMLKQGVPANLNAEYVMSLRASAGVMRLSGDEGVAGQYEARAARAVEAIRRHFYCPEEHLFCDGERDGRLLRTFSPTVNALAVLAGMLPKGEEGAWGWAVERHPQMGDLASPFDASALLEAYLELGLEDPARRLLHSCWGRFVDKNEPCVPERWQDGHDSLLLYGYKGVASRCHPYGAGPAYCLTRYVLGVRPLAPGHSKVLVRPLALGLRLARGRVQTPLGEVEAFWRRDKTEWLLELVLPEGMEAEVVLPRLGWGAGRMVCDGEEVWSDTGWRRFYDARRRVPHRDLADKASARVVGPGRHVVLMEMR